jgi:hypothetical protein
VPAAYFGYKEGEKGKKGYFEKNFSDPILKNAHPHTLGAASLYMYRLSQLS